MTIKLKGSTDGSVSFTAPADTSPTGSDITLTLPTTAGSADQFVKNSGTAGTLEYSSMVETSTGVGIGTSSPAAKLHITAANAANALRLSHTTDGASHYSLGRDSDGNLRINDGATERARLSSAGDLMVGKTGVNVQSVGCEMRRNGFAAFSRSGAVCLAVNRKTNNGTVIAIYQANVQEGTISVNGTTVAYNGGHLSRWSQLAGGVERTEILRGSVLSNLDEMCEWGEEDNEQLNRMKVSDVEGDINVAGVFQSWDDDDDTYTNDFYCAMTGDFIIRIAQGTTVARGDLLMSAGDGTAKPQGDDIIRSKTIAKVTSTVVSETYADGSYCVPCVIMAC